MDNKGEMSETTTTSESYFSENSEISIESEISTKNKKNEKNKTGILSNKEKYIFLLFCGIYIIIGISILILILLLLIFLQGNSKENFVILLQNNSLPTNLHFYQINDNEDDDDNIKEFNGYWTCILKCEKCKTPTGRWENSCLLFEEYSDEMRLYSYEYCTKLLKGSCKIEFLGCEVEFYLLESDCKYQFM